MAKLSVQGQLVSLIKDRGFHQWSDRSLKFRRPSDLVSLRELSNHGRSSEICRVAVRLIALREVFRRSGMKLPALLVGHLPGYIEKLIKRVRVLAVQFRQLLFD